MDYEVTVDGQPVAVYTARVLDPPFAGKEWDFGGPYFFASFDMDAPVTLRLTAKRSLRETVVRPESPGARLRVIDDHTVELRLDRPRKISVEPDGKRGPLLLFANALATNAPAASSPTVIHFAPGTHKPGLVTASDNQTVYLAGGAVVKGAIVARGTNIHIRGRGILDGSDYEWRKGPHQFTVGIYGTNITVSDITVRGSSHWTIVPRGSRNVTVRNVKLCGSRVQNDDGINPCNSQDVLITDCFIRSDDDCVALKGIDFKAPDSNVERITVENCILWCDRARIFLLGHESRAEFMRDVALRNLDIIHFTMTPFLFEPGEEMRLEKVLVENVRIHGEGQREIARLKPVVNQYMHKKSPGHVRDVTFRNVTVSGTPGGYRFQLAGADEAHTVENVRFDAVSVLGTNLAPGSPRLGVGAHVREVSFGAGPQGSR